MPSHRLKDSPFIELGCPFTLYEFAKLVLLLPLLPLRLTIGSLAIATIAAVNSVAAWNWPADKPLTPWRRRVVLLSKELTIITLWCMGFRVRVRGREHITAAERLGAVCVFNHVSWVDAFAIFWLLAPSGVSKASNADLPVIRHAVRALQTIYIPYEKLSRQATATAMAPSSSPSLTHAPTSNSPCRNSSSATATATTSTSHTGNDVPTTASSPPATRASTSTNDPNSSKSSRMHDGMGKPKTRDAFLVSSNVTEVLMRRVTDPCYCQPGGYPMLAMAPEGTTGNGRALLRFRTGAFTLGRPVLPVCLRYRWRGLNPAWTIGDEKWHFLRMMSQFRNDLEVEILPPYRPSEDEVKDPKLFAANVRQLMASALEIPLINASHEDFLTLRRLGVGVSWDGRHVTLPLAVRQAAAALQGAAAELGSPLDGSIGSLVPPPLTTGTAGAGTGIAVEELGMATLAILAAAISSKKEK